MVTNMNTKERHIGFDCSCDLPMSAGMDLLNPMQGMTPEEVELALALATIGETQ